MVAQSGSLFSLSHFFENFYCPFRFPGREQSATAEDYRVQIRNLNAYHHSLGRGDVMVDDLSSELLGGAVAWQIRRGRTAPTANKLARTIAAVWRLAHRRGLVDTLPVIDRLPEMLREPECWSMEEFGRILDVAEQAEGNVGEVPAGIFWPALLWTVLNTGCRISAVMQAPTTGLDVEGGWIKINAEVQKHRRDMLFDLLPDSRAALISLDPKGRGLPTVFGDWPHDRTRRGWRALTKGYRAILSDAGLPDDRRDLWHKMRRTFATMIAAKGGESVAQGMLGHSSIQVTRRYLDHRKMSRPTVASLLDVPQRNRLRIYTDPDVSREIS